MAEFDGRHGVDVVKAVVRRAGRDLAGTGDGAWDEMLERLARQRLLDLETDNNAAPQ